MKKIIFPLVLAIMGLSNIAKADSCVVTGTFKLSELFALPGGAIGVTEPPIAPTTECLLLTITDVTFASTINISMIEPDNTLSDLTTFYNNGLNQATICFSSDPSTSECNALASPDQNITVDETGSITTRTQFFPGFAVTVASDDDTNPENPNPPGISDAIVFTDTTPEPNLLVLLGIGLAGLVAVRRYRRRLSC